MLINYSDSKSENILVIMNNTQGNGICIIIVPWLLCYFCQNGIQHHVPPDDADIFIKLSGLICIPVEFHICLPVSAHENDLCF